ncbi:P1 family peptidase [Haloechinothrix sp. YIM 98757]|uniref:P1 family peptidase n=1 Tax=Haloechinothrix aidingensis TaxID=2752311 RepID=A0A838A5V2_9PSEU|nr:P1 family peptidase [Haloechinothrix aidingensis]MBA0125160.1 P1 family peptidase [Haloechinothrix aidingensis]
MTGAENAITDVAGLSVGHHERVGRGWATGSTVVLVPDGAVCGVDGRGGAPGTRETDLLAPQNLVQQVHGICLSGGSAYGLAAADGVMRWLGERAHGFAVGAQPHEVVPVVPAAVVFDLPRSDWGNRPDAEFGYQACQNAASGPVAQGCVGAGAGAKVGSLKGGVGTASVIVPEPGGRAGETRPGHPQPGESQPTVGALAVVNAFGEAVDTGTGRPWTAECELAGEFGVGAWPSRAGDLSSGDGGHAGDDGRSLNTTIGVVATDAALTKAECQRLAMAAQDGIARAVRPAHSMFDGDTVFALGTGAHELPEGSGPFGAAARAAALDQLCAAAATCFSRAMVHGLLRADGTAGLPAYRDVWPEVC